MFVHNIRAIVPQIAMSAGTMIACSCKEIVMGKHSNLGPIDPQFNGIPAHGVLDEFNKAIEEIKKDPLCTPIWQTIVAKYHPTCIGECQNAIEWSTTIVKKWLKDNMLRDLPDDTAQEKADKIVGHLGSHNDTKTHSRHIHIDEAKDYGLKIMSLESDFDGEFQDLVLSVHHAFMHTFSGTSAIRIIENHMASAVVYHIRNTP